MKELEKLDEEYNLSTQKEKNLHNEINTLKGKLMHAETQLQQCKNKLR